MLVFYWQSYSIMVNYIFNSKSILNWIFIFDRNSSCVLLYLINFFVRKLFINKYFIDISDVFIYIMGIIIFRDNIGKNFIFLMRMNDISNEVIGRVLISRDEFRKVFFFIQIVSIVFLIFGVILEVSFLENVIVNGFVLFVILFKEFKRILLIFEKISKLEERKTQCVGWYFLESRWDQQVC